MLLEDAIEKNRLAQEKKKKAQARALKKREERLNSWLLEPYYEYDNTGKKVIIVPTVASQPLYTKIVYKAEVCKNTH